MKHEQRPSPVPNDNHGDAPFMTASALTGATGGAIAGAIGGPPGAVVGGVLGMMAGALAGAVVNAEHHRASTHDHELDDLIGVTRGTIGRGPHPADFVVVVAGDTGSLEPLRMLVHRLPRDFAGAMVLPFVRLDVVAAMTSLRVCFAEPRMLLEPGTIYVSPPDAQVAIGPDKAFVLIDAAHAKDLLAPRSPHFASAAKVFGTNTIAVVLSGLDLHGADGVAAIAAAGGTVLVQDPETAVAPAMPWSAHQAAPSAVIKAEALAMEIVELSAMQL